MISFEANYRYQSLNRLNQKKAFQKVFACKQRSGDKQFLFIVSNNDIGLPRLGLAIPKRHIRKAVLRNRIKRIIREGFRRNKHCLDGKDMVVLLHAPLQKINQKNFDLSLAKHLKRIGICKPSP